MSTRTRLLTITAGLVMAGCVSGASPAGPQPSPAQAATPSCGVTCTELSTSAFGNPAAPGFVLADQPQLTNLGQPLTLARASGTNAGEDFLTEFDGTVDDFFQAGLLAAGLDARYANEEAFEISYVPLGVVSGLCVGVATAPANGTRVDLEPCGVSVKTVWAVDTVDAPGATAVPFINAATDNGFTDPFVLTAAAPGLPLSTSRLRTVGQRLAPTQLWGERTGLL